MMYMHIQCMYIYMIWLVGMYYVVCREREREIIMRKKQDNCKKQFQDLRAGTILLCTAREIH